jgi:hypothetical protein
MNDEMIEKIKSGKLKIGIYGEGISRGTFSDQLKGYGIYSDDDTETILEICDTEIEAREYVKSLNAADPFALPFEKCFYCYRKLN